MWQSDEIHGLLSSNVETEVQSLLSTYMSGQPIVMIRGVQIRSEQNHEWRVYDIYIVVWIQFLGLGLSRIDACGFLRWGCHRSSNYLRWLSQLLSFMQAGGVKLSFDDNKWTSTSPNITKLNKRCPTFTKQDKIVL